ncbi:hypothetical protein VP1G_11038 [Cytospora mali]|uniref:Uncharacterized protein n=1 Tax=Cytospora mali TaxID=578113 RepID=A0A194V494_CYTMA|nr:hypothetical protein VP1G_11038 [Valsa mali var. pyri (nom. inval.)]
MGSEKSKASQGNKTEDCRRSTQDADAIDDGEAIALGGIQGGRMGQEALVTAHGWGKLIAYLGEQLSGSQVPQFDAFDAGTEWDRESRDPKHSWWTCDGW